MGTAQIANIGRGKKWAKRPPPVETAAALLKCEGRCPGFTLHLYSRVQREVMGVDLQPPGWRVRFYCDACGEERDWGEVSYEVGSREGLLGK